MFKASANKVAKFSNTCNTQGWWEPVPVDMLLPYLQLLNLTQYLEGNPVTYSNDLHT